MTEDDAHGGLEKVLADVLEEFGLPPEAGLTGLLRHMQGNRVMIESLLQDHIERLQMQLSEFVEGVRQMRADGTIVALFTAAQKVAGTNPGRGISNVDLDSFVVGVKESFPQYDTDHRHVPKPEQKEGHDEGR